MVSLKLLFGIFACSLLMFSLCFAFSSLKMEVEKLAQEKTEIQRQYIMVNTVFVRLFVCLIFAHFT